MRVGLMAAVAAVLLLGASIAHADPVPAFRTETAAKKHCPNDEIVWGFNKSGGVFHLKGSRHYGTTKEGAYACRKEAEAGGWRPAKNNQ